MWDLEQSRRIKVLALLVVAAMAVLLLRLVWMQLYQGAQYKKIAEENRIHQISDPAPRGIIYDRNGAVLVSNRPAFAISIIPVNYTDEQDATGILTGILGCSAAEIKQMLQAAADNSYTPVRLKRDVDAATIARIEERKERLPGVLIEAIPVRHYLYNELAAHLMGYIGIISEEEYRQRKSQGYQVNDLVGKAGIEKIWEDLLRGQEGGLQVEVNAMGQEVQLVGEKKAAAGQGLVLTLDANLQKTAEAVLKEQILQARRLGAPATGGAVVALDVKTGGVLALASSPGFDPNLFAGGIGSKDWNALVMNDDHPLTNKTMQSAYPPGSVFKIVTAAAALDLGLTTATEIFHDRGVYVLNGWSFYGWNTKGLGDLDIIGALAWSSDPAFYELGHRLGADRLASYALTFGFGRPSGIKLPGEAAGLVPTENWKLAAYDQAWYPGETLIAAIGQGYYLATPLQQTLLLMAVANGGIMYRPLIVEKVLSADGGKVIGRYQPEVAGTVYLKPEIWDTIRKGLVAVTTEGTGAATFKGLGATVAGKSGSAETGKGTVHSWFSCYAPADNPEIALTVLVEEGGEGSMAAAPAVRKILDYYFAAKNQ